MTPLQRSSLGFSRWDFPRRAADRSPGAAPAGKARCAARCAAPRAQRFPSNRAEAAPEGSEKPSHPRRPPAGRWRWEPGTGARSPAGRRFPPALTPVRLPGTPRGELEAPGPGPGNGSGSRERVRPRERVRVRVRPVRGCPGPAEPVPAAAAAHAWPWAIENNVHEFLLNVY